MYSFYMKQKKALNKVPQVFRLRVDLVKRLKSLSARTNINKTRLVELALSEYFAVNRN